MSSPIKLSLRVIPLAVFAALTVLLASGSASGASPAKANAVVSSTSGGLGRILVDQRGRTLYLFEKDTTSRSTCKGACAAYWPPLLTTGKPRAANGVHAALLGTTKRADGTLQVTYAHHPLYTFALDTKAGLTKGQGANAYGADWYAVATSGASIEKANTAENSSAAPTGSTTTTPTDSSGGYSYGY
jgi:predicted lipoprotein with Yx(FWY)xxD motif